MLQTIHDRYERRRGDRSSNTGFGSNAQHRHIDIEDLADGKAPPGFQFPVTLVRK